MAEFLAGGGGLAPPASSSLNTARLLGGVGGVGVGGESDSMLRMLSLELSATKELLTLERARKGVGEGGGGGVGLLHAHATTTTAAAAAAAAAHTQQQGPATAAALERESKARGLAEGRVRELEVAIRALETRAKVQEVTTAKFKEREAFLQKCVRDSEAKAKAGESSVRDIVRETEVQVAGLRREADAARERAASAAAEAAALRRDMEGLQREVSAAQGAAASAKANASALSNLREQVDKLMGEVARGTSERDKVSNALAAANKATTARVEALGKAQKEVEGLVLAKEGLDREVGALKKSLATTSDTLATHKAELIKVVKEREGLRQDLLASEEAVTDVRTRLGQIRETEARSRRAALAWKGKYQDMEGACASAEHKAAFFKGKLEGVLLLLLEKGGGGGGGAGSNDASPPPPPTMAELEAALAVELAAKAATTTAGGGGGGGVEESLDDEEDIPGLPKLRIMTPGDAASITPYTPPYPYPYSSQPGGGGRGSASSPPISSSSSSADQHHHQHHQHPPSSSSFLPTLSNASSLLSSNSTSASTAASSSISTSTSLPGTPKASGRGGSGATAAGSAAMASPPSALAAITSSGAAGALAPPPLATTPLPPQLPPPPATMSKAIACLLSATVTPAKGHDTTTARIVPVPTMQVMDVGVLVDAAQKQQEQEEEQQKQQQQAPLGVGGASSFPLQPTSHTTTTKSTLGTSYSDWVFGAPGGGEGHPPPHSHIPSLIATTLALASGAGAGAAAFSPLDTLAASSSASAAAGAGAAAGVGAGAGTPPQGEDAYFDDPLRLPYVSIQYIESDDQACLKRLQSIVKLGCPVDQTRDLKTLLYCTASGKMKCVAFLMDQGVHFGDTDACMRVAALAVRYALESWTNIDSKKAREEMSWREKQGAILVARGCPLLPAGETLESLQTASASAAAAAAGTFTQAAGDASTAAVAGAPEGDGPTTPTTLGFKDEEEALSSLLRSGVDPNLDPVYRYDPERIRYTPSDLGAPVPVILGIREFTPDYRDTHTGAPLRFTTWKVAAKQKVANDLWNVWRSAMPKGGGGGGGKGGGK